MDQPQYDPEWIKAYELPASLTLPQFGVHEWRGYETPDAPPGFHVAYRAPEIWPFAVYQDQLRSAIEIYLMAPQNAWALTEALVGCQVPTTLIHGLAVEQVEAANRGYNLPRTIPSIGRVYIHSWAQRELQPSELYPAQYERYDIHQLMWMQRLASVLIVGEGYVLSGDASMDEIVQRVVQHLNFMVESKVLHKYETYYYPAQADGIEVPGTLSIRFRLARPYGLGEPGSVWEWKWRPNPSRPDTIVEHSTDPRAGLSIVNMMKLLYPSLAQSFRQGRDCDYELEDL